MREYGGYLELEKCESPMLHDNAYKLNCARNALRCIVRNRNIKKIIVPDLLCDSCVEALKSENVAVKTYQIGYDFKSNAVNRDEDEWIYLVNYYGQLSDEYILSFGDRIILDNVQAYYRRPIDNIDTIYSCRKFFGVPDGAILYSNQLIEHFEQDESYTRMMHLLGRFERSASEFYNDYVSNEKTFSKMPICEMSRLTSNLLRAIDYDRVKEKRENNFAQYDAVFSNINKLSLSYNVGPFAYPLLVKNGNVIRKHLVKKNIYLPVLWPNVLEECSESQIAYKMAFDTLILPVDQRYLPEDISYIISTVEKEIDNNRA